MKGKTIDNESVFQRLNQRPDNIRIVLDTDTFNEIDDQFALVYALKSAEQLNVEAVYAAPFYNNLSEGPGDGMEKSYEEILTILKKLNQSAEGFVFKGSDDFLQDWDHPLRSEAALDLVDKAMSSSGEPLYIVAIGAITNVASAILIEPRIIDKITVVWLGGHAYHWQDAKEFNLCQDLSASRLIFDCGVPLVHIPCEGVASHMSTTLSEIRDYVKGRGMVGDYLYQIFQHCHSDHFAYSRVLWDIAAIAYLVNPEWVPAQFVHSPVLTEQYTWSFDRSRHLIRSASFVNRDAIFKDFFLKLAEN